MRSIPRATDEVDSCTTSRARSKRHLPSRRGNLRTAADIDPDHVDAHVNLGRLMHEDGAPAVPKNITGARWARSRPRNRRFNLDVALRPRTFKDAIDAYLRASARPKTPTRTSTSRALRAPWGRPRRCGI
jgi:hypothetical protein